MALSSSGDFARSAASLLKDTVQGKSPFSTPPPYRLVRARHLGMVGLAHLYNEVHKALVIITGHRCVCPDHQDTINVGQEMDIVTYKKVSNGKLAWPA